MIYEYRVYETLPGRLPNINARFRDHTMKIFEKHGIKNIGYFTADIGDYSDRLIYIIGFEDAGHRERAWEAFRNDPEWAKVRAESEADGLIVRRVFNTTLTPYRLLPAAVASHQTRAGRTGDNTALMDST